MRYALEGSVRRAGGHVRISIQLSETETGHQLWSDRFDGSFEDIFALQDRVAETVAGVIEPKLRSAEIARSAAKPTEHLDAYDLYLRALPSFYALAQGRINAALGFLRRAVTIDPGYALAKALAAGLHVALKVQGWQTPGNMAEGVRLAREALASSHDDPQVLRLAGQAIARLAGEFDAALEAIQRAVVISPNSAQVLSSAGWVHLYACEPHAAAELFPRAIASVRSTQRWPTC